jgi:hypothetical protein
MYQHLVAADYLAAELPLRFAVDPGDRYRVSWSRNPPVVDPAWPLPESVGGGDSAKRWAYTASYMVVPAFWSKASPLIAGGAIAQGTTHRTFSFRFDSGPGALRPVAVTDVAFPSQKVFITAEAQRAVGRHDVYVLMRDARVPTLFADGSASVRASAEANRGWAAHLPTTNFPDSYDYRPDVYEAPVMGGSGPLPLGEGVLVEGRQMWARRGVVGRDFDGPEVP